MEICIKLYYNSNFRSIKNNTLPYGMPGIQRQDILAIIMDIKHALTDNMMKNPDTYLNKSPMHLIVMLQCFCCISRLIYMYTGWKPVKKIGRASCRERV